MKVYLTGVDTIKSPKRVYNNEIKKENKREQNLNDETNGIREESVSKEKYDEEQNFPKHHKIKRKAKDFNKIEVKKKTNNFISLDDIKTSKNKNHFYNILEFEKLRRHQIENQKNKKIITEELKEDFLDFLITKEPKYADFDKISEDLQKQIYENYKTYNKNLIRIEKKKKTLQDYLNQIEKVLIDNYYLTDSSMIPKKIETIEKTKIDILTKAQEYEGYKKIYEDLYNQNYLIKRQVLDEIDIDRANEEFHDQYKLLEIHAIVQVSKKQDSLNQIEEYYKKLCEDHDKEYKAKNKILKELKLEIEVFKEDEKDLIHKLRKLKSKKNDIKKLIKERQRKNLAYHENLIKYAKKYQKSFISMNKIFKSVNAKNLDDVLLDVNSINARFNTLKNFIISYNQDISELNSKFSKLNKNLKNIQNQIILNKNKKVETFNQREQDKIFKIKTAYQKEKEEQNELKEEIEKKIGVFQNGIVFIFHKIKSLVLNIKILKSVVSPRMLQIIQKYKHQSYRLNYENINKKFIKQFSFLFFQYCNIIFYLSLRMMCSGIPIQTKKNKKEILMVEVNKRKYLSLCEEKIKKALKDYKHRSELKIQKQKEINEKTKQNEIQEKIENQMLAENKTINQKQMYKKFIEYLRAKEEKKNSSKNKTSSRANKDINSKKNSFFFTGIDSIRNSRSNPLESSSSSSTNSLEGNTTSQIGFKKKKEKDNIIPFQQKEIFLGINKNKLINKFSKYQNNLMQEINKNVYLRKKVNRGIKKSKSNLSPKLINYKEEGQQFNPYFSFQKKIQGKKENKTDQKRYFKVYSLFDENYIYDEDEGDFNEGKSEETGHDKKNEIKNYYAFFRLNKDRANIYKKKIDLQKLQMAYFGGRFLNTKINNEHHSVDNNLDDMVDHYFRKQEHGQFKNSKKIRLKNYKKKSVFRISANKSLKDKTSFPWKRVAKSRENCLSNNDRMRNHNYTYVRAKYLDYKKNKIHKSKTSRLDKLTLPPFFKTYNKYNSFSPNNLYRSEVE